MTVPEQIARDVLEALKRNAPALGSELERRMRTQPEQVWFSRLEDLDKAGQLPESVRRQMVDLYYSLR